MFFKGGWGFSCQKYRNSILILIIYIIYIFIYIYIYIAIYHYYYDKLDCIYYFLSNELKDYEKQSLEFFILVFVIREVFLFFISIQIFFIIIFIYCILIKKPINLHKQVPLSISRIKSPILIPLDLSHISLFQESLFSLF